MLKKTISFPANIEKVININKFRKLGVIILPDITVKKELIK